MRIRGWACECQAHVHTCVSLLGADMSGGWCVKGRGPEIFGAGAPGWGSGRRGLCCV